MLWLVGVAVVMVPVGVYASACWLRPYRPCPLCKGFMVGQSRLARRALRPCWWCKGAGLRLRLGRRVFNHFADLRRAGQPRRHFGGTP